MKRTFLGILALAAVAQGAAVKTVCSSGCDYSTLQSAIDAASYGWVIEVAAGETFSGEVQLKKKTGTPQYIVIRSSAIGALPPGKRITPADAPHMPKLEYSSTVITAEAGASYYRIEGLEIAPASGKFLYSLIALYPQTTTGGLAIHEPGDMAHHIILDRCYIHGIDGEDGPHVGVYLETGYTEIVDSWIGEIKDANSESKAILNVGGSGPFVFRNNHLEAAAITTLMGGANPSIAGARAADLTFVGNHYYRPWKWRVRDVTSDPTGTCRWDANGGEYARNTTAAPDTYWKCQTGTWTGITSGEYPTLGYWQKNQFELKNASRVLFDGNLIENAWLPTAQNQRGSAILLNQVDYDPGNGVYSRAAVVEWLKVQNNRVKNTTFGVNIGGNGQTYFYKFHDLRFENNLWEGLAWAEGFGAGSIGLIQTGWHNQKTYFMHNTFLDSAPSGGGDVAVMTNTGTQLTYEMGWVGNISGFLYSGFHDFEKSQGNLQNAIQSQWDISSRLFSKNVVADTQGRRAWPDYPKRQLLTQGYAAYDPPNGMYESYPPVCQSCAVGTSDGGPWNWENGGTNDVGFVDYAGGNYRLAATSPYKRWGHLGRDAGADIDIVEWSTEHAADGAGNPYLDFRERAVTPGRTSASLRFTAYDVGSCKVTVSDRPDLATTVFEGIDEGGNRDRVAEIAGLSANTRYFYRIVCSGSHRRDGVFLTAP